MITFLPELILARWVLLFTVSECVLKFTSEVLPQKVCMHTILFNKCLHSVRIGDVKLVYIPEPVQVVECRLGVVLV